MENAWVFTRWAELARRGKFICNNSHIDFIVHSYSNNRFYHSLRHIEDLLSKYDDCRHLVPNPIEAELIIWLHDIFQKPGHDNEKESAEIAERLLQEADFTGDIELVKAGIIATDHVTNRIEEKWRDWPPQKLMTIMTVCDLDLTILAGTDAGYQQYTESIRQEYSYVPDLAFLEGRLKVLEYFNDVVKTIFLTEYIRDQYESRARLNIAREITSIKERLAKLQQGQIAK